MTNKILNYIHTSRRVGPGHDLGGIHDIVEGGPPRTGLVLGRRAEERVPADHAQVLPGFVVFVVLRHGAFKSQIDQFGQ